MHETDGWLVGFPAQGCCLVRFGVIVSQPSAAGFVTRSGALKPRAASIPRREMVALAEAHQVANVHISSLLGVFLTPELNPVWNDRLVEQRLLYLDGIRHAYQVYEMPCAKSSH